MSSFDQEEFEALVESGEVDAVFSEIDRIKRESEEKGVRVFHPDKYMKYLKMVKLAKKIEEIEPGYEITYNFGLPLLGAGITIRDFQMYFDENNKLFDTFKEIISLADSVWIGTESEEQSYIEITILGVYTFHIDEDTARDIIEGNNK